MSVAKRLYRKRKVGEMLEVGDVIVHEHSLGKQRYTITRVSKMYAFAPVNDVAETKYKRLITGFGKPEIVPRPQWDTVDRTAYQPIPTTATTVSA